MPYKSLEDSGDLPPPDELAQVIADDLQTAYEQFAALGQKVKGVGRRQSSR